MASLWGEIGSDVISDTESSLQNVASNSELHNISDEDETFSNDGYVRNNAQLAQSVNSVADEIESTQYEADPLHTPCQNMLHHLAETDAHFKHQQRGEPDLTHQEKVMIAADLFENKPSVFLGRFARYLREDDLSCFDHLVGDYVIDFHIKDIRRMLDDRKNKTKVRNRRYEAMRQLQDQGNYFSDEEMKARDPLLYEQMVGQYLTEDDIAAEVDKTDLSLSNILLKHIQIQQNNELYNQQKEEARIEEDDSEDEAVADEAEGGDQDVSEADRKELRQEFVKTMQQRFLDGEDKNFDYSKVDDDAEYDSLDIRGADEEERYFDEEGSETAASISSCGSLRNISKAPQPDEDTDDYMCYDVEYDGPLDTEAEAVVSQCVKRMDIDTHDIHADGKENAIPANSMPDG